MKVISLYIHVPFCLKKCRYCDFNSDVDLSIVSRYLEALIGEMRLYRSKGYVAKTIYIGGGTPTVLSSEQLQSVINGIYDNFEVSGEGEFSVEVNPGTLTYDKIDVLKSLGVNRISLGLQAYQDRLLKALGRIHTVADFEDSIAMLHEKGFADINVDVMFGIPCQSKEDFKTTLERVVMLKPSHISAYSLIIEEGTEFYTLYQRGKLILPSEDDERAMYHDAIEYLASEGFGHYEISNFAMAGRRSLHNMAYWKCDEYLGLGAGSHSYMDGKRFSNIADPKDYISSIDAGLLPMAEIRSLSIVEQQSEYCFMRLRLLEGICKSDFCRRFGTDIHEIFGLALDKLIKIELLEDNGQNIKLTSKGLDFANDVFVEFLR